MHNSPVTWRVTVPEYGIERMVDARSVKRAVQMTANGLLRDLPERKKDHLKKVGAVFEAQRATPPGSSLKEEQWPVYRFLIHIEWKPVPTLTSKIPKWRIPYDD